MDEPYLPISKINTVVYCQRRYFIECVLGEERANAHVTDGDALHARTRRTGEGLWVWSDDLRIHGILDQLVSEGGQSVPVEFKKGWLGEHESDAVQLGAELLCLREMGRTAAEHGYLYYHATRRRQRVELTPDLTARVAKAAADMRAVQTQGTYPPVTSTPQKCRGCSVRDACQPTLRRP